MKKILIALLACIMLLTSMPALAADVMTSGNFQYTIRGNGTVTIIGYTGEHKDIILPGMIDGYTVATIGKEAFACDKKQEKEILVTLPATVTTIEENAFKNRNVRSINLPNSLEYIGYGAFAGSSYEIQYRFSGTHPLFAVIDGSLYHKKNKELLAWGVASEIPEGILSIGDYACYGIGFGSVAYPDHLLKLPSSVKKIGEGAFAETSGLFIWFTDCEIEEIPDYAFYSDNPLKERERDIVRLPQHVKKIGKYAFAGADLSSGLSNLSSGLSNSNSTLGAFLCEVEEIGAYAFSKCYFSHDSFSIEIPGCCKVIGEGAFFNLALYPEITGINLAEGIERIESKAFQQKSTSAIKFDTVYLPKSLEYIADDAFPVHVEFLVEPDSYAQRWAADNAYSYKIQGEENDLDWLN